MKKFLVTLIFIIIACFAAACEEIEPQAEYFSVTFCGENITEYTVNVKKDELIDPLELSSNLQSEFLYWATDSGERFDFTLPISKDVTLFAVWDDTTSNETTYYTVNFYGLNGEIISSQKIAEGKSASSPAVEVSDFFVFNGWDKDTDCVLSNMDVYASERYDGASADLFEYSLNKDSTYTVVGIKSGIKLPQMAGGYVKLALPTEYNGVAITAVADGTKDEGVFSRLKLLSVYIPSCYKRIGDYAFYGNPYLSKVVFNEGLVEIGEGAFMATFGEGYVLHGRYANSGANVYVSALTDISLPSSLETVGAYAFNHVGGSLINGNYVFSSVNLTFGEQSNLKEIGEYAFEGVQINTIKLPQSNGLEVKEYAFAADTYLNWIYTGSYDYPCSVTTKLVLPSSLKSVGDYAFMGLGVKSTYYNGSCYVSSQEVILQSDKLVLDYVGKGAFKNAKLKSELNLTTDVVGAYAFYNHKFSKIEVCASIIDDYAFCTDAASSTLSLTLADGIVLIGEGAFMNNSGLTSVYFPTTLTQINDRAFYGCSALSGRIVLPTLLYSVGKEAFAYTSAQDVRAFGDVVLGDGCFAHSGIKSISGKIASVGAKTFLGCTELQSVVIPIKMTEIPEKLFYGCEELTSVSLPVSVTTIGESAFGGCKKLASVNVSENVKIISAYAFSDCTELNEVTFVGNKLSTICEGAFAYCPKLSQLDLPDSVVTIGDYAFRGSGLTQFKTPASLKTIGTAVFKQEEYVVSKLYRSAYSVSPSSIDSVPKIMLPSVDTVTISRETELIEFAAIGVFDDAKINRFVVEAGNKYYSAVNGILYNAERTKLILYVRNESVSSITIPEGVEEIADGTFYGNSYLYSVTLPSTLKSIGNYAFYGCNHLQTLTVPASVVTIGDYAFAGSSSKMSEIKSIKFEEKSRLTTLGEGAFAYNKALKSIKLPASLVTLADKAFYGASALTSIDFSDACKLEQIGSFAFSGELGVINKITSVDLSGCKALLSTGECVFANCALITSVNFGNVSVIGQGAFYGCSGLASLEFTSSLKRIDTSAFRLCTNLKSIDFGNDSALTSIGDYAFAGTTTQRTGFEYLDLSKATALISIGDSAFAYGNVKSVTFPCSSFSLGSEAFEGCVLLTDLDLGNGITEIGQNAFRYCDAITKINIPASVKIIQKEAFFGLNLAEVNVGTAKQGNSLTSIGKKAFFNCKSLSVINIYGSNVPSLVGANDNYSFHYLKGACSLSIIGSLTINVDVGMLSRYVNGDAISNGWEVYKSIITQREA